MTPLLGVIIIIILFCVYGILTERRLANMEHYSRRLLSDLHYLNDKINNINENEESEK